MKLVPASSVVRHVNRKSTAFHTGPRSRRRRGAATRSVWPLVDVSASVANGRSGMLSADAKRRYARPVLGHRFLGGADALPETRVWQPRPPSGTPSLPSSRFDRPVV